MVVDLGGVNAPYVVTGLGGEPVSIAELLAAPVHWPRPSLLRRPLPLPPRASEAAATLGIHTLEDLFEHVPAGHQFRAHKAIAQLRSGDEATIEADLLSISLRPTRRRNFRIVEAMIADDSATIKAVWFNQAYLVKQLEPGSKLRLFGRVKGKTLQVREHTVIGGAPEQSASAMPAVSTQAANAPQTVSANENSVISVYPGTEGLKSQRLRAIVAEHRGLELHAIDPLPGRMLAALQMVTRATALCELHFPRDLNSSEQGRQRLAFEEMLVQQLALAMRRRRRAIGRTATALAASDMLVGPWLQRLPFELTDDQRAAIGEIDNDLSRELPMQRLLMGEVGSGKTVVALAALLRAVENDGQAVLMAPTETLAEQHFATLDAMLPQLPMALLTGSTTARNRRQMLDRLASGELPLIVGTHALIEPDVEFRRLLLAVVDEQHRFGVRQRAALDRKAPRRRLPHVLHMTATPIPRTLALTGYGDLDFTQIRQLPSGREPIETRIIAEPQRADAYEQIRQQLRAGRQAYLVCALVSDSEELQARAAISEAERLAAGEFADFRVGLIHGQMNSADKGEAMRGFASGKIDLLVATSVIEVGIDVANASVIAIENADRYGISQLHQLRGRIGRGPHRSTCLLFGAPASPRLRAVASEHDGFKLAHVDLELRGSGEELGTKQSGLPRFKVAVLPADQTLLELAKNVADRLLATDPDLSSPELALLGRTVTQQYGDQLDPIPA